MGAVFTVPLVKGDVDGLPGVKVALVPGQGFPIGELSQSGSHLRDPSAKVPLSEVSLLVGAERAGLPNDIVAQADLIGHIPVRNDSLNVAMAATVALYELANRMAAP
jgi:TrmH family RNA methyltransferase